MDKPHVQAISQAKEYPKHGKAQAGYLEIGFFKNADLHTGYFCYNCIYYIKDNQCAIVRGDGPDVRGKLSNIIAPHGCCQAYDPNYGKLHDTREPGSSPVQDTEKNLKKTTSADVT